jgi:hypothetical protein
MTAAGAGENIEGSKGPAAAMPPPQPNTTPLTPAQDKNSPHPYPSPLVGEGKRERGLYRGEREKGRGGLSLEGLQIPPSLLSGRGPGRGDETSAPVAGAARLPLLLEKLTADGFQNVRVGARGEELLVVEYENSRYNYNELDGLGVAAGTVVDTIPSGFAELKLVLKKHDLRIVQLRAPLEEFRAFLHDPEHYADFNHALRITTNGEADEGVMFIAGPGNPSWLKSSLVVYPGLITYVATEVGTFDYLLSAKLDYYLNAWKGAVVNARWDVPITWTGNFYEGKAYGDTRKKSQFERLMLFQTIKAAPGVMANFGAGMLLHNAYGTLNEVMWTPGEGTHRFRIKQAYVSSRDSQVEPRKSEVYLGSYRYYFSPLDLSLEGTGGRFFENDKGFVIEIKRFFGDTAFSVFYRDARTPAQERVVVGGAMISLPLTPRRDMKPYPLQVRGSEEWSYHQETRIVTPGQFNFVSTSTGVEPILPYNLARVFYNRDRLSEPYIRKHLLRLRDAYLTYVEQGNHVAVK